MFLLEKYKVESWPKLKEISLSPSFYLPCNILALSKHAGNESHEYLALASQFQCLEAWCSIPSCKAKCLEYLSNSRCLQDYLIYTKALLKSGETQNAITLLERTVVFDWPETLM